MFVKRKDDGKAKSKTDAHAHGYKTVFREKSTLTKILSQAFFQVKRKTYKF